MWRTIVALFGKAFEQAPALKEAQSIALERVWELSCAPTHVRTIPFRDENFGTAAVTKIEELGGGDKLGSSTYDDVDGVRFYRKPRKYGVYV